MALYVCKVNRHKFIFNVTCYSLFFDAEIIFPGQHELRYKKANAVLPLEF